MTCGTCRHYQPLGEPAIGGLCRYHAPQAVVLTRFRPTFNSTNVPAWPNETATAWPPVNAEYDYCAQHTPQPSGSAS